MATVRYLVDTARADVDVQNGAGDTALIKAAYWGQVLSSFIEQDPSIDDAIVGCYRQILDPNWKGQLPCPRRQK